MIKIEINISLKEKLDPLQACIAKYQINPKDIKSFNIVHQSLDLRRNHLPHYVYQIELDLDQQHHYLQKIKKAQKITPYQYITPKMGDLILKNPPIIVGAGPAGLTAAYYLAKKGYQPIIIEKGQEVESRKESIDHYWQTGILNESSNIQFGEGGAGAFSDGKLTTRIKDYRVRRILEELVSLGADEDIMWMNHPHLGSDNLFKLNQKIRNEIIKYGGKFYFNSSLKRIHTLNNEVVSIELNDGREIKSNIVLLGIGNSARDIFRMLKEIGVEIVAKPFAVGVRVEHLQSMINDCQYQNIDDYQSYHLPAAEYFLTNNYQGKGTYSFCMCPGGYVIASASEKNTIVTNGMSYSKRDGINANSAILVQIDKEDYGDNWDCGIIYQETLEQKAFTLGNGKAPSQKIASFINEDVLCNVNPTYNLGVYDMDIHNLFSKNINDSLEEFFKVSNNKIPGFTSGIITAVESRSSSPVRIIRNKNYEASIKGLYPIGEGSGYAGGIMSSAIDGLKAAEIINEKYHNF